MSNKYEFPHEEKDGGFYFEHYDIHVAAETLKEAIEKVEIGHGVDVRVDPRPPIVPEHVGEPLPAENTDESQDE